MRIHHIGWGLLFLSLLAWAVSAVVQDPKLDDANTRAIRKAQFLFQFAKSNDWPSEVKSGPFRIGVHNNPAVVEELTRKFALQPVGAQLLEVVEVGDSGMDEFVHILYSEATGEALNELVASTVDQPVMVITAVQEAMPQGAVVNFLSQEGRTKYELNLSNAEERGLLVGNRILSWAVER